MFLEDTHTHKKNQLLKTKSTQDLGKTQSYQLRQWPFLVHNSSTLRLTLGRLYR